MRDSEAHALSRSMSAGSAVRDTMAAALLAIAGNLIGMAISVGLFGWAWPDLLRLLHAALAGGVYLSLRLRGRSSSLRRAVIGFLLLVVPLLALLPVWMDARTALEGGEDLLFITFAIVIMGVALLTPSSVALGAILVLLFTAEAIALWLVATSDHPMASSVGAWGIALFAAISIGLLVHRRNQRALAERLVAVEVELGTLERLSAISREVRDQVNTPLQTLQLSVHALRRRAPDQHALLDRMDRAVDRLAKLSRRLSRG